MVVGGRTMKTVLLFHLNSLAIVLVLSQTKQPYFAPSPTDALTKEREREREIKPTVCKLSNAGREYAGPLNITRSGRTCQRWNSNKPHSNYYKESTRFPEGSAEAAGNKCRNPDSKYNEGVWCYTTDPDTRWEECDVPFCDCKLTNDGREYAGPLNITRSGRTCQRWNSDETHYNYYKNSTLFPEGSAAAAGNKCRNPDSKYKEGVWCYTTYPDRRWEACDVKLCDCKLTNDGREYAGPLNITRSGRTCQRWNSDQPHEHRYRNSTLFPEGSAEAAGNKCRNPDGDYYEGVWCYTTSLDTRWEECDVKLCDFTSSVSPSTPQTSTSRSSTQTRTSTQEAKLSPTINCKLTRGGREYAGPLSITRSGLTCQRWNSNQPHEHRYRESMHFPEGSAEAAGNKCRNPERDYNEGVWCYTTSPDKRWEECDVKFCDLSGENESINIVKIVIPIVGVIVIICVVATIYAWKRAGLFQSSRNRFNTPNAEGNQQGAVAMDSMPNQNDDFDYPVYDTIQEPTEQDEVTKDYIMLIDSGEDNMSTDNVKLS